LWLDLLKPKVTAMAQETAAQKRLHDITDPVFAGYHKFKNESDEAYGSFEVFHHLAKPTDPDELSGDGWYWWACFPGCLPDGDPSGPYKSAEEAYHDALGL
jgi:hypothetical protein